MSQSSTFIRLFQGKLKNCRGLTAGLVVIHRHIIDSQSYSAFFTVIIHSPQLHTAITHSHQSSFTVSVHTAITHSGVTIHSHHSHSPASLSQHSQSSLTLIHSHHSQQSLSASHHSQSSFTAITHSGVSI
jgi:hypothetical protein